MATANKANTTAFGPGPSDQTLYLILGPYQIDSLIELVILFGRDTSNLIANSGVTYRVAAVNTQQANAENVDAGTLIVPSFTIDSPASSFQIPIANSHKIGNFRYIAVEMHVKVTTPGSFWIGGATLLFRAKSALKALL